jgi:hypothetical protein
LDFEWLSAPRGTESVGTERRGGDQDMNELQEFEPIMAATRAALRPPPPLHPASAKPDPRLDSLVGRVAKRCVRHLIAFDRTIIDLGSQVARLVRHHDRVTGLSALARRIRDDHGRHITPQHLGQALTVFESYTREEFENRFSTLSGTHLLVAAQAYLSPDEHRERNEILDDAQRETWSVSEFKSRIKIRRQASNLGHNEPEDESGESREEPRGYLHDVGLDVLGNLSDRSVALLWLRSPVAIKSSVEIAGRVLQHDGLLTVECPSIAQYPEVHQAVARVGRLKILHVVVVADSSINRRGHVGVSIVDRYELLVLVGCNTAQRPPKSEPLTDNPMGNHRAREIVLGLIPENGCVVDAGHGSIQTAKWAKSHHREFLAIEPNAEAHESGAALFCQHVDGPPTSKSEIEGTNVESDLWPMVPTDTRVGLEIDGAGWDEIGCCDRTRIAATLTGTRSMSCPLCGVACIASKGRKI